MFKQLKRWAEITPVNAILKDDSGAALVEYGLLVGLIAVVCLASVQALGITISGVFNSINVSLTAALA
jgi:pilus assembly protein Flp/PilA